LSRPARGRGSTQRERCDKTLTGHAARLAEHEAPNSPLLVAQGIGDLEALLHGLGVDSIDVSHLDRYPRRRGVVVANDGHWAEGLVGEATVTTQPVSIATSKPNRSRKKSRVSVGSSDLMFGTALLMVTLAFYRTAADRAMRTPNTSCARSAEGDKHWCIPIKSGSLKRPGRVPQLL
jgi:hypothetical protein